MALAGTTKSPLSGMFVMFIFSAGLAIPYVLAGLSFNWVIEGLQRVRRRQIVVERLAGFLMLYIS
ncbi:MAG: cytochrome c biogenesis protein CcdA [Desulfitobacteriaceae bacterium]|nr:cytochrome c biogenesis protein CcdA [Desulfitobacteriaceae bacterium]